MLSGEVALLQDHFFGIVFSWDFIIWKIKKQLKIVLFFDRSRIHNYANDYL